MIEIGYLNWLYGKKLVLRDEIILKRKVYFDTNIWVNIRKGLLNSKSAKQWSEKIKVLHDSTSDIVYPMSFSTFAEIMGQSDTRTRNATAIIVGLLSANIGAPFIYDRFLDEMVYTFNDPVNGMDANANRYLPIWARGQYIVGTDFANKVAIGIAERAGAAVQDGSLRQFLWDVTIGELIYDNSFDASRSIDTTDLTKKWNDLKLQSLDLFSSLKRAFDDEVAGCVKGLTPQMKQAMALIYFRKTGKLIAQEIVANDAGVERLRELIYQAFKRNKLTVQFPTIGIMARLHALIGREKDHKYQEHDMLDIDHASIGAGYCNAFVGERRICAMMKKGSPSISDTYHVDLYSNLDSYLESISKYRR